MKETSEFTLPPTLDPTERAAVVMGKGPPVRARPYQKTVALLAAGSLFGLEGCVGDGSADWTVIADAPLTCLAADRSAHKTLVGCLGMEMLMHLAGEPCKRREDQVSDSTKTLLAVKEQCEREARQAKLRARALAEKGLRPKEPKREAPPVLSSKGQELPQLRASPMLARNRRGRKLKWKDSGKRGSKPENPLGELPPISSYPPPPVVELPFVPKDSNMDDKWRDEEEKRKEKKPRGNGPMTQFRAACDGRSFLVFSADHQTAGFCRDAVRGSAAVVVCVARAPDLLRTLLRPPNVGRRRGAGPERFTSVGIDMTSSGAEQVLQAIRETPSYHAVPIFALLGRDAEEIPEFIQAQCSYVLLMPLRKPQAVRDALCWCTQLAESSRQGAELDAVTGLAAR